MLDGVKETWDGLHCALCTSVRDNCNRCVLAASMENSCKFTGSPYRGVLNAQTWWAWVDSAVNMKNALHRAQIWEAGYTMAYDTAEAGADKTVVVVKEPEKVDDSRYTLQAMQVKVDVKLKIDANTQFRGRCTWTDGHRCRLATTNLGSEDRMCKIAPDLNCVHLAEHSDERAAVRASLLRVIKEEGAIALQHIYEQVAWSGSAVNAELDRMVKDGLVKPEVWFFRDSNGLRITVYKLA